MLTNGFALGIYMNDINELFFELIRVAFGNQGCMSRVPSAAEWQMLYDMAKKQSLVGICFAGVQRLQKQEQTPPELLYLKWMGMAAKIQQRNEIVSKRCKDILDIVNKAGFKAFLMKGQCNAGLYELRGERLELSKLRQSGDIDIYVDGGREKVLEFVQRTAPTSTINEIELEYSCFDDADVDMHYSLPKMRHPFRNKKLNEYLLSWIEANYTNYRKIAEGVAVPCPVFEYDVVFQLEHIYRHFISEGVGLRQIMDFYFLLFSAPVCFNHEAVKKSVDDIGLTEFACGLMWVLETVFNPMELETWNKNTEAASKMLWMPSEKDGRMLLNEILLSGNFGKQDARMKGLYASKWNTFWMVNMKTVRFWRFDHWAWFWSPVWRGYHFIWKRINGFTK